jgi:hypothetical protein
LQDGRTGGFVHYRHDPRSAQSLINDEVWAIAEDPDGDLWLATNGGLDRLDPDRGSFTHYRHTTDADGIGDSFLRALLVEENGDLWIADVGQGEWEEIDLQRANSIGGENYGWRRMEGTHCFNPGTNCQTGSLVLPVIEYGHGDGSCSVTGGFRYRGTDMPRLRGQYVYGDFCTGVMWTAAENSNGTWTPRKILDSNFQISTYGEDIRGELYVAAYNTGVVYRIIDTAPLPAGRRRAATQRR